MGFLDKVLGSKEVGTLVDIAQVAAPVVDIFAPGVGTAIQAGATMAERAGADNGYMKELSSVADGVSTLHNTFNTFSGMPTTLPGITGPVATGASTPSYANVGLGSNPSSLGSLGNTIAPFIAGAAERGISGAALNKYNDLEVANAELMVNANHAAALQAYEYAVAQQQAAQAAAAARAAAARQTEENRQRALRRSNKVKRKYTENSQNYYEPFRQAGLEVLPIHTSLAKLGGSIGQNLGNSVLYPVPTTPTYSLLNAPEV